MNNSDCFTMEKLNEAMKIMDEFDSKVEAWLRKILSDKGFDPDRDLIILPRVAAKEMGLSEENIPRSMQSQVRITDQLGIKSVFLCKSVLFNYGYTDIHFREKDGFKYNSQRFFR
jgi:hypothetical protein